LKFEASLEKSSQDPILTEKDGYGGLHLSSYLRQEDKIGQF
jgi:hypothetical protein